MTSALPYPVHSIADAVKQMDQGEDPWFALGGFLHDWWCYAKDARHDLISEPPTLTKTPEGKRWAALCAAVVEELCLRSHFPCPAWVNRQDYMLEEPWWYSTDSSQREWLLATTPEPFRRRNIFIGGSVLDNKYELHQMFGSKPKLMLWSDQELEHLLASNESAESEIVP